MLREVHKEDLRNVLALHFQAAVQRNANKRLARALKNGEIFQHFKDEADRILDLEDKGDPDAISLRAVGFECATHSHDGEIWMSYNISDGNFCLS